MKKLHKKNLLGILFGLMILLESCTSHPAMAAEEERSYGESKVQSEYVETGDEWDIIVALVTVGILGIAVYAFTSAKNASS